MKIVVVGATRTIGTAVVSALEAKHEVIRASRRGLPLLSKITVSWTSLDWSDCRDALPRDPRQDVQWLSSGAALLIVYAFRRVPAPHVHRRVPDVRRRTRPSASTIGGGYTGHDHQASWPRIARERVPPAPATDGL